MLRDWNFFQDSLFNFLLWVLLLVQSHSQSRATIIKTRMQPTIVHFSSFNIPPPTTSSVFKSRVARKGIEKTALTCSRWNGFSSSTLNNSTQLNSPTTDNGEKGERKFNYDCSTFLNSFSIPQNNLSIENEQSSVVLKKFHYLQRNKEII